MRGVLATKLNLEMAASDAMVDFAVQVGPEDSCLVPERREELTTEGGLSVHGHERRLEAVVGRLKAAGITVSLFIDPEPAEIRAAAAVGAPVIELHTGAYADAPSAAAREAELKRLRDGAALAASCGLVVNAGHGLTVQNVGPIAAIPEIVELNIGHSLVARAVFVGIEAAVAEMIEAMRRGRAGTGAQASNTHTKAKRS
jgi:pyridoxine 5-phosphate synthase